MGSFGTKLSLKKHFILWDPGRCVTYSKDNTMKLNVTHGKGWSCHGVHMDAIPPVGKNDKNHPLLVYYSILSLLLTPSIVLCNCHSPKDKSTYIRGTQLVDSGSKLGSCNPQLPPCPHPFHTFSPRKFYLNPTILLEMFLQLDYCPWERINKLFTLKNTSILCMISYMKRMSGQALTPVWNTNLRQHRPLQEEEERPAAHPHLKC